MLFQLVNVICGISGHGGKYACAYCEGESNLTCGKMRTIGSLKYRYKEFVDRGCDKKKMMDVKNVINPPLLEGSESDQILEKLPPPELHLMMGAANKIWDLLSSLWGSRQMCGPGPRGSPSTGTMEGVWMALIRIFY